MNVLNRLLGLTLIAGAIISVAQPAEADPIQRLQRAVEATGQRVEKGAKEWDPFNRDSNMYERLRQVDRGTMPYREDAGWRALDAGEDYLRIQMGLPPDGILPSQDRQEENFYQQGDHGNFFGP